MKRRSKMGKYRIRWHRIWEFVEELEAETEEEAYDKILEERATAGSKIEIQSVVRVDLEEAKQEVKEEEKKAVDEDVAAMVRCKDEARRAEMVSKPRKKEKKK